MSKNKRGKKAEKARAEMKKRRKRMASIISIVKDVVIALVIVLIVMGSLFAYSGGIWPPMVVVESESMMHGPRTYADGLDSQIGIIDTGDLTLVKKIDSRSDIITYVEGNPNNEINWTYRDEANNIFTKEDTFTGRESTFKTYGDYGEVVIYRKNGIDSETPVIHRAMVWLQFPSTVVPCDHGADFPDIRNSDFPDGLKCVTGLTFYNVGYQNIEIKIDVMSIIQNAVVLSGEGFSGFLTKGDHNINPSGPSRMDQETHTVASTGQKIAPIKVGWVVGEAVGEFPAFGSLKLVLSGTRDSGDIPPSSWTFLIVTIILIITIPFIIDLVIARIHKRKDRKKKKKKAKKKEKEEEEDEEGDYDEEAGDTEPDDPEDEDEAEEEEVEDLEMDLDDEFGDEFEDMAPSKKKKK